MRSLRLIALLSLLAPAAAAAQDDDAASEASEDAPTRTVEEVPEGQPRYLGAMRSELSAMRVRGARCEATDAQRARCSFTARGITTGREFPVHMVYSDRTDTIYLYVERYLEAPADADGTPALLRRLMELNWTVLLGKFEWDPTDGEVRLAMVLNTDSNFDRRAFRSAVRGIGQLADRYYGELQRLASGE
jgi:hypothetical protein